MEGRLQTRLDALQQMLGHARLWRALAWCWAVAAATGVAALVVQGLMGWGFTRTWALPLVVGAAMAGIMLMRRKGRLNDVVALIREIEPAQPQVRHLLSAAAEQTPDEASGTLGFLQMRVIEEALAHPRQVVWRQQLSGGCCSPRSVMAARCWRCWRSCSRCTDSPPNQLLARGSRMRSR